MNRYQLYLDHQSVSVLDEIAGQTDISRSKLIQRAVYRLAQEVTKVFIATKTQPTKRPIFDSLIGFINIPGKKSTDYARHVDDAYLHD